MSEAFILNRCVTNRRRWQRDSAPGDGDTVDCFAANCRWKSSGILWTEEYVRLITGSRLLKSYHIQRVRGTTPPGSHIPILMNLPS